MIVTAHPLPLPPGAPPRARSGVRRAAGTALGGLALVLLLVHAAGRQAREVRQLAPDARGALCARTVENLRTVCRGEGRFRFADFCEEQARLALDLPECDAACGALARETLRNPTR